MPFWNDLAVYCANLAPVATPAIAALGHVAGAVSNAELQIQALREDNSRLRFNAEYFESIPRLTEEDFHPDD